MSIRLFGHRGMGCTDSFFARRAAYNPGRPAENTLPAFRAALDAGADGVELDIVRTSDDVLAVIHSDRLADHIFSRLSKGQVGTRTVSALRRLQCGPRRDGLIPLFDEVLDFLDLYAERTGRAPVLNVEIKDVKGTRRRKFPEGAPPVTTLLARALKGRDLSVIVSSFALTDLQVMHAEHGTKNLALLFDAPDKRERYIYRHRNEDRARYQHFTPENIRAAAADVPLTHLHPEITSVTPETIQAAKEAGTALNIWARDEKPPQERADMITEIVQTCARHTVPLGIITDHLEGMRTLLEDIAQK